MEVSAEKLAEVDRQLGELERSDDEIASVLARFEDREPPSLEEVDAELEGLAADVEGIGELLARVRENVASALAEREAPAAEPVTEAEPAQAEAFDEELPTTESEPPPSAEAAEPSSLDAADLFGDQPSDEEVEAQAEADFAALFEGGQGGAASNAGAVDLADSLEGDLGPAAEAAYEEEPEDSTSVFTSDDIQAIRADASHRPAPPTSAPPPPPTSAPPPPPSQRPSQRPRDPEIDALLGDDEAVFRPSSPAPPTTEAQPVPDDAMSGEFELLVDEDVMLIEDEEDQDFADHLPTRAEASPFVPDQEGRTQVEPEAAPEGEQADDGEAEGGEKKGFFKKLFGE